MSKRDWAVAVAIGLCAIGLVACGGGGSGASGDAGSGELSEAALEEGRVEMSECLREHGVDVPDPVAGEKGLMLQKSGKGAGGGGVNLDDPATQEALEACEDEVDFKPPEMSPEQEEEMKDNMLAFAQCMREHGVDMPDPEFEGGGKVKMRIGGPDGAPDLDGPAFEAAQEACQEELPDGGFGFKAGP
jgi:hypothetical protein